MEIKDMPKLESPFIRTFNEKNEYIVTSKINPGYDWVLNSEDVVCMEKLDGTNVSIIIKKGKIVSIFNRKNEIQFFDKKSRFIIDGLLESNQRGYCELEDGQHFGELIGDKLKGKYSIKGHIWIPFKTFGMKHLVYKSWHKYPKTYENIREWFMKPISEGGIFSLFERMKGKEMKPEGVIFYNLKTGQMAKLRIDMFDFYEGQRHEKTKKIS
jgi:hypothetical protein